MIVNADKFQAIILDKKESEAKYKLSLDNNDIKSTKSVKLLAIAIDDPLRFHQHISNLCLCLCSKVSMYLNALSRLQKYMGKSEKPVIINSFIYANFNYCPWVWHSSIVTGIVSRLEKLRKSKNVARE